MAFVPRAQTLLRQAMRGLKLALARRLESHYHEQCSLNPNRQVDVVGPQLAQELLTWHTTARYVSQLKPIQKLFLGATFDIMMGEYVLGSYQIATCVSHRPSPPILRLIAN